MSDYIHLSSTMNGPVAYNLTMERNGDIDTDPIAGLINNLWDYIDNWIKNNTGNVLDGLGNQVVTPGNTATQEFTFWQEAGAESTDSGIIALDINGARFAQWSSTDDTSWVLQESNIAQAIYGKLFQVDESAPTVAWQPLDLSDPTTKQNYEKIKAQLG